MKTKEALKLIKFKPQGRYLLSGVVDVIGQYLTRKDMEFDITVKTDFLCGKHGKIRLTQEDLKKLKGDFTFENNTILQEGIIFEVDNNEEELTPKKLGDIIQLFHLRRDVLEWCSKAISNDETRYVLNGLFIGEEHVVATDGKRLHYSNHGQKVEHEFIIHHSMIKILLKTKAESFTCYFDKDGVVSIQANEFEIIGKTLEGKFPNYKQVIPNQDGYLRIFETSDSKQFEPFFDKDNSKVKITSDLLFREALKSKFNSVLYNEIFEINLNARFISDVIGGFDTTVSVSFTDKCSPYVFKNKLGVGIIMPLRIE